MHYEFPAITRIEDCLAAIEGHKEFVVAEREGYTIINYVMQDSDTFSTEVRASDSEEWRKAMIRRECRGIVFDAKGNLMSRRLHKFFNVGEKEETAVLDLSKGHHVMDKLDGSMMTPLFIDGGIRWGTKMGVTEIALRAENFVLAEKLKGTRDYEGLARECRIMDATPIFEWLDNDIKYQVVIQHTHKQLVLLHIRDNYTGEYYPRHMIDLLALLFKVPAVKYTDPIQDWDAFKKMIEEDEDNEGVVIQFDDGHMVKLKTGWYLILHRAKAAIEKERDVCCMIVSDELDDMLPLQPVDTQNKLLSYQHDIKQDIENFVKSVEAVFEGSPYPEKRDFAIASKDWDEPALRNCVFQLWPQKNGDIHTLAYEWAKENLRRAASSNDNFEKKARHILKTAIWKP